MIARLDGLLAGAVAEGRAIAGFNVFGLDEAIEVVAAAERVGAPVILMTNKEIVRSIPVEVLGPALRAVAERASVPVGVHLDHTYEFPLIYRAVAAGYTSVMFDGSQLPFAENVARTKHVVEMAHACGVSVEGEIGSVSYNEAGSTIKDEPTDPGLAADFCRESGVDAVAVSIGTVHKLTDKSAAVDRGLLAEIAAATDTPLVIHGGSGVPNDDLRRMAQGPVAKFNIGTVLRRAWGDSLRAEFEQNPGQFDRYTLTRAPLRALRKRAEELIALLANGPVPKRERAHE